MSGEIIRFYNRNNVPLFDLDLKGFTKFTKRFNGKRAIVLSHMLENMDDRTNIYYGTCKSISEKVNVSRPTVTKILDFMIKENVVEKKQDGVWELHVENIA